MITPIAGILIGLATFSAAFVTGIFGMVGGQILLATLLFYLPVSAAMTLFSATMFASGFWRAILWRKHIAWETTLIYVAGTALGYVVMLFIAFVPSKPVVYLGLGLTPFIGDLLPAHLKPDISKRPLAFFCGFIVMVLQIAVGAGGNVLDMFFQASPYNRHQIVATKAITQLFAQVARFVYFGSVALEAGESAPWWLFVIYALLTFVGGSAAGGVLNRISDTSFRKWTKWLIWFFSAIYTGRGIWLLIIGSTT